MNEAIATMAPSPPPRPYNPYLKKTNASSCHSHSSSQPAAVAQCSQDSFRSQQPAKQPTKKRKVVSQTPKLNGNRKPPPPAKDEFDDGLDDDHLLMALDEAECKRPAINPVAFPRKKLYVQDRQGTTSSSRERSKRPAAKKTPKRAFAFKNYDGFNYETVEMALEREATNRRRFRRQGSTPKVSPSDAAQIVTPDHASAPPIIDLSGIPQTPYLPPKCKAQEKIVPPTVRRQAVHDEAGAFDDDEDATLPQAATAPKATQTIVTYTHTSPIIDLSNIPRRPYLSSKRKVQKVIVKRQVVHDEVGAFDNNKNATLPHPAIAPKAIRVMGKATISREKQATRSAIIPMAIQAARNSSCVLEITDPCIPIVTTECSQHFDDVSTITTDNTVTSSKEDENMDTPAEKALKHRLICMAASLEKVLKRKFPLYCYPNETLMHCIDQLRYQKILPIQLTNGMSEIRWLGHVAKHRPKFPIPQAAIDDMIRMYQELREKYAYRL